MTSVFIHSLLFYFKCKIFIDFSTLVFYCYFFNVASMLIHHLSDTFLMRIKVAESIELAFGMKGCTELLHVGVCQKLGYSRNSPHILLNAFFWVFFVKPLV